MSFSDVTQEAPEGHTLGTLIELGTAILIIPVLLSYWKIWLYNPLIWKIYGSYTLFAQFGGLTTNVRLESMLASARDLSWLRN